MEHGWGLLFEREGMSVTMEEMVTLVAGYLVSSAIWSNPTMQKTNDQKGRVISQERWRICCMFVSQRSK